MQTFIAKFDTSGTYFERILSKYLYEDGYRLTFNVGTHDITFGDENLWILIEAGNVCDNPFEDPSLYITIDIKVNDISTGLWKSTGLALQDILVTIIEQERSIHRHLTEFKHLMYSELYIYFVAEATDGFVQVPLKYKTGFRENRYTVILANLALLDKGEYPDPDAYRGLAITRTKSAR